MDIELLILTGASISRPTRSASAKETRGGVSIGLKITKVERFPSKIVSSHGFLGLFVCA